MEALDDSKIIALFNERSQKAIDELSEKYGKLCFKIAKNILGINEDAEECVNETLLALWNAIPPASPDPLSSYTFAVTRKQALKMYHKSHAKKRNSTYDAALDELENLFASSSSPENDLYLKEFAEGINSFLENETEENRVFFVRRYYFGDSVKDISGITGASPHLISVRLQRTREALKKYLEKEGLL